MNVRPRRVVVMQPPKTGKSRAHLWGAFGGHFELGQPSPSDVIGLQMRTPKTAVPKLKVLSLEL